MLLNFFRQYRRAHHRDSAVGPRPGRPVTYADPLESDKLFIIQALCGSSGQEIGRVVAEPLQQESCCYVMDVAVAEAYRKQGIASELLIRALRYSECNTIVPVSIERGAVLFWARLASCGKFPVRMGISRKEMLAIQFATKPIQVMPKPSPQMHQKSISELVGRTIVKAEVLADSSGDENLVLHLSDNSIYEISAAMREGYSAEIAIRQVGIDSLQAALLVVLERAGAKPGDPFETSMAELCSKIDDKAATPDAITSALSNLVFATRSVRRGTNTYMRNYLTHASVHDDGTVRIVLGLPLPAASAE